MILMNITLGFWDLVFIIILMIFMGCLLAHRISELEDKTDELEACKADRRSLEMVLEQLITLAGTVYNDDKVIDINAKRPAPHETFWDEHLEEMYQKWLKQREKKKMDIDFADLYGVKESETDFSEAIKRAVEKGPEHLSNEAINTLLKSKEQ